MAFQTPDKKEYKYIDNDRIRLSLNDTIPNQNTLQRLRKAVSGK